MSKQGPKDVNEVAYRILQEAVGDVDKSENERKKDPAAVALGRKGGLVGGKARALKLTSAQRSAIAKKAAEARWRKSDD